MHLLQAFLNLLSVRNVYKEGDPAEFQIDDTYSVPGVGNKLVRIPRVDSQESIVDLDMFQLFPELGFGTKRSCSKPKMRSPFKLPS